MHISAFYSVQVNVFFKVNVFVRQKVYSPYNSWVFHSKQHNNCDLKVWLLWINYTNWFAKSAIFLQQTSAVYTNLISKVIRQTSIPRHNDCAFLQSYSYLLWVAKFMTKWAHCFEMAFFGDNIVHSVVRAATQNTQLSSESLTRIDFKREISSIASAIEYLVNSRVTLSYPIIKTIAINQYTTIQFNAFNWRSMYCLRSHSSSSYSIYHEVCRRTMQIHLFNFDGWWQFKFDFR